MAYTKTVYVAKATKITAVGMNNIENAVAQHDEDIQNLKNNTSTAGFAKQIDLDTTNLKLDDVLNPLVVSLSLDKTIVEQGSTVNSVVASWSCSKTVVSQTFEGVDIDASLRIKTYTTPITDDKTFTLTSTTSGGTTVTKTATLSFANGVYYGKSSSVTYDSALISSLTKVLSDSKARTITVTAGTGEYIYYALPTRLGTPTFSVGGFTGGFDLVATVSYTNSSNYTENYYVYKSTNANLGSTTVTIS
jgi:hypothetical protein